MSVKGLLKPALVQRVVQYTFLAIYVWVGIRFYAYAQWAMGNTDVYTPRPPSVEGFLPISALLGAKRLFLTGMYDPVHPAGLTVFLFAIATALLLRKSFCGYLCPVGTISMFLGRLGQRLGIARKPEKWFSVLLSVPKYLLLLFFVNIILIDMDIHAIEGFIRTPYNMVADTKMLLLFLRPSTILLVTLGVLVLGGVLIPGFWCRGFCPYGALLGLFSWLSPVAVRRDASLCVGCRRCERACPSRIPVQKKLRVSGPECVGCAACVNACAEPGCLSVRLGYTARAARLPVWIPAIATLSLLYLFLAWATASGHWENGIAPNVLRMHHQGIDQIGHP